MARRRAHPPQPRPLRRSRSPRKKRRSRKRQRPRQLQQRRWQQRASSGAGTDVVMPQMGESIFEGTITKWLKKVGDSVQRDEPLFEISTDKVDAEIPSPAGGTLSEIKVEAGSTVQINTVVAVIGGGAAKASAPAAATRACSNSRHCDCSGAASAAPAATCRGGFAWRTASLLAAGAQDCEGASARSAAGSGNRVERPHHQGRCAAVHRERWCGQGRRESSLLAAAAPAAPLPRRSLLARRPRWLVRSRANWCR